MGTLVQLVFRRLGINPAVASGPLTMTLNDGFVLGSRGDGRVFPRLSTYVTADSRTTCSLRRRMLCRGGSPSAARSPNDHSRYRIAVSG